MLIEKSYPAIMAAILKDAVSSILKSHYNAVDILGRTGQDKVNGSIFSYGCFSHN